MSLVTTLSQEFRTMSPDFDRFELRLTTAGLFDAFKRQTAGGNSFITPALKQSAMRSIGNTQKIPVINYKDVTIRSTRPLTISADENTSALYTVVWTTLAYGFKMYPAQHQNNDVSYQLDWNKKYRAMIVKMLSTLEGLAFTAVDAAKTKVLGETLGGHAFASDVLSETGIASLKDSYILHDLNGSHRSNNHNFFNGDLVGNQGFSSIIERLEGFGKFNQENKTLPYNDKFIHYSNDIANAVGKDATGFAICDGQLGILTRVEADSLMNT